ncbi:MAG: SDR family NAD(P)-dependent oxidoreductase [Polyangiaceae bacterium]|nr:SDR family NAD(P)-dependent oxidoreductase [Polyangiaceae bacterium]
MGTSKTALVTGATGAIGEAIARAVANEPDYTVVLACRDPKKGEAAARRIRQATRNNDVHVEAVDVGLRGSIDALRARWRGALHALINNAAIAPRRREVTEEGIERQFAVNVLGYTRMTARFADALESAADARVVNVASYWAGDLDLDDLQFETRRYDNNTAYRQSKQANRMLTVAEAERLEPRGILVNACHPGDVNSTLSNDLGFGGSTSAEDGARTPAWLALELHGRTGKYFADCEERPCQFARERAAIAALEARCAAFG